MKKSVIALCFLFFIIVILLFLIFQKKGLLFLSGCAILNERHRYAPLAQLDRVSGYGPEGQGFESLMPHH